MNTSCEGYACPPTHSVPVSTVIVHRLSVEQLPATGADPTGLVAVALTLTALGAVLTRWARPGRKHS